MTSEAPISPGDILPVEILQEIFLEYSPPKYDHLSERMSIIAPSHVCQHWRSVALRTPELWTYILLKFRHLKDIDREVECAREWLLRSSARPISIIVDTDAVSIESVSDMMVESAIEVLVPCSHRWRDLTGKFEPSQPVNIAPNHQRGVFTAFKMVKITAMRPSFLLRSLKEHLLLPESADVHILDNEGFEHVLCRALRLRSLTLRILDDTPESESTSLIDVTGHCPWSYVTHLNICNHSTLALHAILDSHVPHLEHLTLSSQYDRYRGRPPILLPIVHNTLKSLHVPDFVSVPLLNALTLPRLQDLAIDRITPSIESLIKRSTCSLLSLELFETPEIPILLKFVRGSSIEKLSIAFTHQTHNPFEVLNVDYTHTIRLLPNLRHLEISKTYYLITDEEMVCIVAAIESRWIPEDGSATLPPDVCELTRVNIVCDAYVPSDEVFGRLKRMREEGLDLTLMGVPNKFPPYERIRVL